MFVHQMDLRAGTEITEGDTVEFGTADYKGREKAVDVIKVDPAVRAAAPRALAPPGVPAKPRVTIAPARPRPKVDAGLQAASAPAPASNGALAARRAAGDGPAARARPRRPRPRPPARRPSWGAAAAGRRAGLAAAGRYTAGAGAAPKPRPDGRPARLGPSRRRVLRATPPPARRPLEVMRRA